MQAVWLIFSFIIVTMFHTVSLFRVALRTSVKVVRCNRKWLSSAVSSDSSRNIVFLGIPLVAAKCLETLVQRSGSGAYPYKVVAAVTQPPAPVGKNRKITKSPVHEAALKLNVPVFTPETAKDEEFLHVMESSKVDLFITAAYGNYLPKRFLEIAPFGTINIHPSLLPKYRGAAPVQRCLENGDRDTGVTLLYSVQKMDAGPILTQLPYPLSGDEKADKVLDDCFDMGINKLVDMLPIVFDKQLLSTVQQNESLATAAPKIAASEGLIDFSTMTATQIHNKCRAFSEWPGSYAYFQIGESAEPERIKLITTRVVQDSHKSQLPPFKVSKSRLGKTEILQIPCYDGSVLGILEIQRAGKKVMDAKAFINGLRGNIEMVWVPHHAASNDQPQ